MTAASGVTGSADLHFLHVIASGLIESPVIGFTFIDSVMKSLMILVLLHLGCCNDGHCISFTIYYFSVPTHLSEHVANIDDLKNSVAQLYSALNIEEHQIQQEKRLLENLEKLRTELEPLEKVGITV
jgi:hypothetical protein